MFCWTCWICCNNMYMVAWARTGYMCLVLPKLMPLWLAPLLLPYCKLITPWPALSCSSEKLRTFFSASFGPMLGCPYWEPWTKKEVFKICVSNLYLFWLSDIWSVGNSHVLPVTKRKKLFGPMAKAVFI